MRIRFISIGKTKETWLQMGIACYEERLKHYCSFERVELPDIRNRAHLSIEQIKKQEEVMLLQSIDPLDDVTLLDERGVEATSESLSMQLEKKMTYGVQSLVFIVGGAYGFSPDLYTRANEIRALSRLTFSHQMVRVIFMEQLYRCFTIIKGEPYHHR